MGVAQGSLFSAEFILPIKSRSLIDICRYEQLLLDYLRDWAVSKYYRDAKKYTILHVRRHHNEKKLLTWNELEKLVKEHRLKSVPECIHNTATSPHM